MASFLGAGMYYAYYLCGSLNVMGPPKIVGSGSTRKCSFVGIGVALLEKVFHCRGGFEVS